jgi:site-specific recombinase XerD
MQCSPVGHPRFARLLSCRARKAAHTLLPAERGDGHFVGIQKPCQRVREAAGLDDLRIHDLRHSFASIAVASGDSLYLIGKVFRQRQSRTTERYAHLKDDPVRAVANLTSERIAAIMPGSRGTEVVPLASPKPTE